MDAVQRCSAFFFICLYCGSATHAPASRLPVVCPIADLLVTINLCCAARYNHAGLKLEASSCLGFVRAAFNYDQQNQDYCKSCLIGSRPFGLLVAITIRPHTILCRWVMFTIACGIDGSYVAVKGGLTGYCHHALYNDSLLVLDYDGLLCVNYCSACRP